MSGLAVGVTIVGIVLIIVGLIVIFCHYLGIWIWITNWLFSSNEEKVQLTKSGHFSANGYMMHSDSDMMLNSTGKYHLYDNIETDFRFMNETGNTEIPPQPLRPAPVAPVQKQHSVETISDKGSPTCVDLEDISPNLKRAMSCDSVSSDTSVMLELLEEPEPMGQLEVGLEYDKESADLIVTIVRAKDLTGTEAISTAVDSYIRVFLLPDKSSNMQTRIQKNTNNPVYKERFLLGLEDQEITKRTLVFYAFTCDKYTSTLIGEAELKLADIDLTHPTTLWLTLTDSNQKTTDLGEIMFSLSYLPTAERLTVVVVKARNLRWTHNRQNADPFAKVYLLQNGKKISKKKTSVKKDERNPIFNEAMIFSVPANVLQTVQLRITIAESQPDGHASSIGHVIVGSQATGKALSHWNQMMSSLRKPIAMWHPLRK